MSKALFVAIAIVIAFPAMADPWPLHPPPGYGYGEHRREHMEHERERAERERAMERAERERHEQWCRYHPGVCR